MIQRRFSRACLILLIVGVGGFLFQVGMPSAAAQDFPGLLDAFSPLFSFPRLEAEARVTPIWTSLLYANLVVPSLQVSWDLKDDFALEPNVLFLDSMLRIQVGRFSLERTIMLGITRGAHLSRTCQTVLSVRQGSITRDCASGETLTYSSGGGPALG